MNIKEFARTCFRRMGLDVRRFHPGASSDAALIAALNAHSANLVLDVGANTGQFGRQLRELGYRGRIVSFEPLSLAHRQLVRAAQGDALWSVAERMAIGSEEGEIDIHVAGNSVSSSVLRMLDAHVAAAPSSAYVDRERVRITTLDAAAIGYITSDTTLFIKIDTQGYEHQVLQGASQLIRRAIGLQLELSLVPLYEGQRQYDEMIEELKSLGFELWSISPAFIDKASGRLLQVDASFFR